MKASPALHSLLVIVPLFSWAQPVLQNGNAVPAAGYTSTMSAGIGGAAGNAGADQTWDFSAVTVGAIGTIQVVTPSTTPYAGLFPQSNYSWKLTATSNPQPKYDFWNVTASKYDHVGANFGGQDGDDYSPDPICELKFPFAFQDSIPDTYVKKNRTDTNRVTFTYDAYGTLKLAGGSHAVIRIKRDNGTSISYTWYTLDPLFPLASFGASNSLLVTFTSGGTGMRPAQAWIAPKSKRGFILLAGGIPGAAGRTLRGLDGKATSSSAAGFRGFR